MRARRLITLLTVAILASAIAPTAQAQDRAHDESIDYHEWSRTGDFRTGHLAGLTAERGELRINSPVGTIRHTESKLGTTKAYEYGQWTSPEYRLKFDATQLIASWNAHTPAKTWL